MQNVEKNVKKCNTVTNNGIKKMFKASDFVWKKTSSLDKIGGK